MIRVLFQMFTLKYEGSRAPQVYVKQTRLLSITFFYFLFILILPFYLTSILIYLTFILSQFALTIFEGIWQRCFFVTPDFLTPQTLNSFYNFNNLMGLQWLIKHPQKYELMFSSIQCLLFYPSLFKISKFAIWHKWLSARSLLSSIPVDDSHYVIRIWFCSRLFASLLLPLFSCLLS